MVRHEVHYLVIGRACAYLFEELAQIFSGRPDIKVVIDRRYGERRKAHIPVSKERRKAKGERRRGVDLALVKGLH